MPYSAPIPVKVDPALLERLDALSKQIGEPRSTVMRMAMRLGVEAFENSGASDAALKLLRKKLDEARHGDISDFPAENPGPEKRKAAS